MDSYHIQFSISLYDIVGDQNYEERIKYRIEDIKRRGAIEVFEKIYNSPTPMVVDSHLETWDDPASYQKHFKLHYRLMEVRTMNFTMATIEPFVFTNHAGVVEWKCLWCGAINTIEATYCGEKHEHAIGCGRPREKTRQEM